MAASATATSRVGAPLDKEHLLATHTNYDDARVDSDVAAIVSHEDADSAEDLELSAHILANVNQISANPSVSSSSQRLPRADGHDICGGASAGSASLPTSTSASRRSVSEAVEELSWIYENYLKGEVINPWLMSVSVNGIPLA
eukprot:TRINITY_DN46314_c0_g1_i1.p1 TRINITY_DN46314_c0_g1~~TRINITY_DN46314_c0_g1_i1.p1  ORF type:complete len:166 (+),score=25.18 TRINITY_DN46314_c0_g1_i1:72-500(+)